MTLFLVYFGLNKLRAWSSPFILEVFNNFSWSTSLPMGVWKGNFGKLQFAVAPPICSVLPFALRNHLFFLKTCHGSAPDNVKSALDPAQGLEFLPVLRGLWSGVSLSEPLPIFKGVKLFFVI